MSIRVVLGLSLLWQVGVAAAENNAPPANARFTIQATQATVEAGPAAGSRFAISASVNRQQSVLEDASPRRFSLVAELGGKAASGVCLPEIFKNGFEPE